MFNHFDDYFVEVVEKRKDLRLEGLPREDPAGPIPSAALAWILHASRIILENCTNRQLYASSEHLCSLLACDDVEIALAALSLLATSTRRPPG